MIKYELIQDETVFGSHVGHDCFIAQSSTSVLVVVCKECDADHIATVAMGGWDVDVDDE